MNKEHLTLCSSAEWAEAVQRRIIPWVLEVADLGDDVLEVGPGPGLTTDVLRTRTARGRGHQRLRGPPPRGQALTVS